MRCCISQDSDPPPAPEAVQESNDGSKDLQQEGSRLSMPQLGGFTSICWQQFCLRSAAYRDHKNFARWCHHKGRDPAGPTIESLCISTLEGDTRSSGRNKNSHEGLRSEAHV